MHNARLINQIRTASQRGVVISDPSVCVDMDAVQNMKNKTVDRLVSGIGALMKSYGVTVYKGEGALEEGHIVVGGEYIAYKKAILAGGSISAKPPIPGAEHARVLDSDALLRLREVPKSLCIVGGGVIGVEMATIFSAFGSAVIIVEAQEQILPGLDAEVAAELKKSLVQAGVKVRVRSQVQAISEQNGALRVRLSDTETLECDYVLLCVGRKADLSFLGGAKPDMERGFVAIDESFRTSLKDVYAIGDITGKQMLAHTASKMGELAARHAMGQPVRALNYDHIPACVYGEIEAGCVGLTETRAREQYGHISAGKFMFSANGRALGGGEGHGFVKVVADAKYGEILGVHIAGPNASEMINEAALAMQAELTIHELTEAVHAHPTFSEALMEAAADAASVCRHLPKRV